MPESRWCRILVRTLAMQISWLSSIAEGRRRILRERLCLRGGASSTFEEAFEAELINEHNEACDASPFCFSGPLPPNRVFAAKEANFVRHNARGSIPDFESTLGNTIFVSREPFFPTEECQRVIANVEEHMRDGWTHLSTGRFQINGDWIRNIPGIKKWLEKQCEEKIFPTLKELFPEFVDDTSALCIDSAYIFKYTSKSGPRTDVHTDSGCLSFTIALNSKEDYEGGGTWFEGLGDESKGRTVTMDEGQITLRPGGLRHQGYEITAGSRYVIGGFIVHRRKVEKCRRAIGKGTRLAMEGKYAEAERALKYAVNTTPTFDGAYVCLADAQRNQGFMDEAISTLENALKINPTNGEAIYSLASIKSEQGAHDESYALYDRYLNDIEPCDVDALFHIASELSELQRFEEEVRMINKLLRIAPPGHERLAAARTNLGVALGELGDLDGEMEAYKEAIREDPSCKNAWFSLGSSLASAGRLEEAQEKYKHILAEIEPNDMAAYNMLYKINSMLSTQTVTEPEDF